MWRVFPAARIRAVRAMPSATEPGGIPASAPPAGDPAMPELRLLPGRHKRVRAGHPWVFSNEIAMDARARGLPPGGLVRLAAANGEFVALAGFNPRTLIAARVLARDPAARIDRAFLARRLAAALELRERLHPGGFYRLVHAEADGLPGVVVDRFGDLVSVQLNTATAELLRADLLAALQELLAPRRIVLRNDAPSRALEGLDLAVETPGAASDDDGRIEIRENGAVFLADLRAGQKTGWFFDQRENRARVAGLSAGARVLDAYCYAGGFGVLAALRGAREVVLLEPRAARVRATRAEADDWEGVDRDLLERLRRWRRRVAEARGKPAWTIFDDKSLRSIARDRPASPAALLRCRGIGEKRLADFGAAILDIVAGREPADA
jgi:23S rRNA (cytosine1962-C5)-methyltransferase